MRPYLAHIKINLKLTLRDRMILFFNYAFPLVFFFIFAQAFDAKQGGAITQVISMVLIIGVLGTGFFGAGIRSVQEREQNILRRFKVAPITASPILTASVVVGWAAYLPSVILFLLLAHVVYKMPVPAQPLSLLAFISIGVIAFRSVGLVVASVVNSMQESQIVTQLLYLPMLFLSGATFPITILPDWLQVVAQFLPATHLFTGLQAILIRGETLGQNLSAVGALLLTTVVALFIGNKLFRWEKDEKLPASAKLWLLVVFIPFILLGTWETKSRDSIAKSKQLSREMARGRTTLIKDARIVTGDSDVIPSGSVLIRNGKIDQIFSSAPPKSIEDSANVVEGAGKTILPGLIDVHVHLGNPGGIPQDWAKYDATKSMRHALIAYLYSGVTTVRSVGDSLDSILAMRKESASGERYESELLVCGPLFTTEGGHGTEFFTGVPEKYREQILKQFVRTPKTPDEARAQVRELKTAGVDAIKAVLDAGQASFLFNRMDASILRALVAAAHAQNLPVTVHTGDSKDIADAVAAGADGIEHGSDRDRIPDLLLAEMAKKGVVYDPTLAVVEAWNDYVAGKTDLLDRPMVQQVGPVDLIASTKKFIDSPGAIQLRERLGKYTMSAAIGMENLQRAHRAGVNLVAGTDSGNMLLFHGPALHRELQLWVQAGVPAEAALRAATSQAARALHAEGRIGSIAKGHDATLLLLDGNPLQDITVTERISGLYYKGERIGRSGLFEDEKK
jgi:imidazolonepropionase-like amidohydrolase/ABC-type multidrug transport system permease subunit